ncbi:6-phosphofructokinase [Candidatus Termititenax persephonae]|uniref:ATP-dependent 6-phosphofructokinase n=1 Tax=Candidatus Termititenax persephonae TaxID=2218525 RepID=A0A388TFW5_9BACT|nr:6-phosphofructokinase [Candidatus Termititenax persephonae]
MQDVLFTDLIIPRLGVAKFDAVKTLSHKVDDIREDNQILFCRHSVDFQEYAAHQAKLPLLELAGPRAKIFFNPRRVKVGIVTCGGLCPGLNTIIRSLVFTAHQYYGIRTIYGFRYGYSGLNPRVGLPPLKLDPDSVDNIHAQGGTILGSSRGPQEAKVMVDYLETLGVNVLFVVGGDGTMRGALDLTQEVAKRRLAIAIIGIPKTIDNDIAFIGRSFGFESAVEEATRVIAAAHMEAKGAVNGIGLVKLMGRESGFIAANAALASCVVNFCLIPESPFRLDKFLPDLERRIKRRHHAVIVVAEGAGQDLIPQTKAAFDKSGNKRLQDIGAFLKNEIVQYFTRKKLEANVRYIDPSYAIRSVAPTGDDNVFCLMLGQSAVHAAMSGRTAMVVGHRNEHFVHLPMTLVTRFRKKIEIHGRVWRTVLDTTGQAEYK